MDVPTILSERLVLRAHEPADFRAVSAMWADERVTRFISGKASTPQQTWMRVLTYAGHWKFLNFGYWAIAERATDTFVGEGGFADFKRSLPEEYAGIPELGFAFVPEFHGRGYAREAIRAMLAWADETLPVPRTIAITNPENERSIRVLERNGYDFQRQVPLESGPVRVFQRPRRVVST